MPLTEKGKKVMRNMRRQYGYKKGAEVFYASKNAGKIMEVEGKKGMKKQHGSY